MSGSALGRRLRAAADEFFYQVGLKLGEQFRQDVERRHSLGTATAMPGQ